MIIQMHLERPLCITFLLTIMAIYDVNMYLYKFAGYYAELISGREADELCKEKKGSLLFLTDYTIGDLLRSLIAADPSRSTEQLMMWTRHRVSRQKFEGYKTYNEDLPFDENVKDMDVNSYCIYATLWLWNETVTWVPAECDYQIWDSGVFCLFVDNSNNDHGDVNMYLYKFAGYYAELISGREADELCKEKKGSLLFLTDYTIGDLLRSLIAADPSRSTEQLMMWTRHRVSRQKFEGYKTYNEDLPFDENVKDMDVNSYCIYATLWLWNETVTWVPAECDYQIWDSGVFCLFVDNSNNDHGGYSIRWIATLFTEPLSWDIAYQYCQREGAELLEFDKETVFEIDLRKLLSTKDWLEKSVSRFWLGQKTQQNNEFFQPITDLPYTNNGDETNCVFTEVTYSSSGYPELSWSNADCSATLSFICICRPQTDSLYLIEVVNKYWDGYFFKSDGLPYTVDQCKSEVLRLMQEGHLIAGFNYHKPNATCTFFGNSFANDETVYDNDEYNVISLNENIGYIRQHSNDNQGNQLPCWRPENQNEQTSTVQTTYTQTDEPLSDFNKMQETTLTEKVEELPTSTTETVTNISNIPENYETSTKVLKSSIKLFIETASRPREGVFTAAIMATTALLATVTSIWKIMTSIISQAMTQPMENQEYVSTGNDEDAVEIDTEDIDESFDECVDLDESINCNNIPPISYKH